MHNGHPPNCPPWDIKIATVGYNATTSVHQKKRHTKCLSILSPFHILAKPTLEKTTFALNPCFIFMLQDRVYCLKIAADPPKGLITAIKAKLMGEVSNCKSSIEDICLEGQNVPPYNSSSFLQHVWCRTQGFIMDPTICSDCVIHAHSTATIPIHPPAAVSTPLHLEQDN